MDLGNKLTLKCPIRGELKTAKKSKDGLTATEEYFRVEAIKYLINKLGYPKENFKIEPIIKKFGNNGRNSFRSDFAILDVPAATIDSNDPDILLSHALLLCEVKKDNAKSTFVKNTQVEPMLEFAKLDRCVGLYWDNIEQRVFWQEKENGTREIKEGPISFIPSFGDEVKTKPLTYNDTRVSDSLLEAFSRIEDILHQAAFDPAKRYEIILQLLLTKIFDEHQFEQKQDQPMGVQDYSVLGTPPEIAKQKFEKIVEKAITYYEKHLPNPIPKHLPISGETLVEILKILAPLRITKSKRDVVQTFYMKFAKDLYKWDLAQYFTPTTVTDFIVDVINPQFGEHVCDPACGSADFLVAAFRANPSSASSIWGVDNSANAVQVSILNMLLNGDGKTNIIKDDSLEHVDKKLNAYEVLLCNPPFGAKIQEKRKHVLQKFDLGHEWVFEEGVPKKSDKILAGQETGLLFVEVCVKQCKPNGRMAIILPNGYFGNRSHKYRVFRERLLKNTKVASIVSFPRFTFKSSGADVSASVIFLQKRETPIENFENENYDFAVEMIENVGWEAGNKKALPTYKRNPEDGSYFIGEEGDLIIDSDFKEAINRIRSSEASADFNWLTTGQTHQDVNEAWSVNIRSVLDDPDLTLDPKRYCRKVVKLREELTKHPHHILDDIVDFIPERRTPFGDLVKANSSSMYGYVEIQDINYGDFNVNDLRGWELPSRGRHFATEGDIYFGAIWGSVSKWCYMGDSADGIVVTNGCHRCRVKKGQEHLLVDLLAYMNTNGWSTQLRALARGSDGLAEISVEDAKQVIIPAITDKAIREELQIYVDNLKKGRVTMCNTVSQFIRSSKWQVFEPSPRPSHIVLV